MQPLLVLACWLLGIATAAAQSQLEVGELPPRSPLAITAQASSTELVVELKLDPEWHVYARDVGGGQPVALTLAPDCGFQASGALRLPADKQGKLAGKFEIHLPIAARLGSEPVLRAELQLQVCDALECLPPLQLSITGRIRNAKEPFPVLLVVDVEDERSERIASFLRERGFTVTVTSYPKVTAEACEAHAVVLADSKLFGKTAKVRDAVLKFPATSTPIVAVGHFGTELVKAQGVAMTSGYI